MKLLVIICVCSALTYSCKAPQPLVLGWEKQRYVFKDAEGNTTSPPLYDKIRPANYCDCYMVSKAGMWGIIDLFGNSQIPIKYDSISEITRDGIVLVELDHKWGGIHLDNSIAIPIMYERLSVIYYKNFVWHKNYFTAELNGKMGVIDDTGELLIPCEYEVVYGYDGDEGLLVAKQNGMWGYINSRGVWVIPNVYDKVEMFKEGLAVVKKGKQWGAVDANNITIIPFEYDHLTAFSFGVATATKAMKTFNINPNNQVLSRFNYEIHGINEWGLFYYESDSFGYIDTFGNKTFHPTYNIDKPEWGTIEPAPTVIPDYSAVLCPAHNKTVWTLPLMLNHALNAVRDEPRLYGSYTLPNLITVCIGYGLSMCGGNYSESFMNCDDTWQTFKEKTIFKILGSEKLRQAAWGWAAPYVKTSFQSMHPYHRQIYRNCAAYLKAYMDAYDIQAVKDHLKNNERRFAYYHPNGNLDPYRKLSAFVDRLIVLHKVISIKDARQWVAHIANDVQQW